jgi:hypothetical protein
MNVFEDFHQQVLAGKLDRVSCSSSFLNPSGYYCLVSCTKPYISFKGDGNTPEEAFLDAMSNFKKGAYPIFSRPKEPEAKQKPVVAVEVVEDLDDLLG